MRYIFGRVAVYSYTFFIFIFSILPVQGPAGLPFFDKVTHFFLIPRFLFL